MKKLFYILWWVVFLGLRVVFLVVTRFFVEVKVELSVEVEVELKVEAEGLDWNVDSAFSSFSTGNSINSSIPP